MRNERNYFKGTLPLENFGVVSYDGHEADWYLGPGEEWKTLNSPSYFFVVCSVQLPLENEPRKLCAHGDNRPDALKRLEETILVSLVMSECVFYFPERSLRDNLDSQEYLDGLKKYGVL